MTVSWPPSARSRTSARSPGSELVRLRLPDRPGSLAGVLTHLAAFGVDVLGLEVLERAAGFAVDDLLVAGPALDDALAELGAKAMVLARRPGIDLRDGALAMAAACEAVAAARSERDAQGRVLAAALGLVFAEAGVLLVRREHLLVVVGSTVADLQVGLDSSGPSLISSALASGECLTADGRIPWAPPALRDSLPAGSVAVVPAGSAALVLALVRDDDAPFVGAELARLAGLMRVAGHALGLHDAPGAATRLRLAQGFAS